MALQRAVFRAVQHDEHRTREPAWSKRPGLTLDGKLELLTGPRIDHMMRSSTPAADHGGTTT
jgi:hypothetical protein